MTLPLPSATLVGKDMPRVSRHVACAQSWMLIFRGDLETGESEYVIELNMEHPLWSLAEEVVNHLPGILCAFIHDSDLWARLSERFSHTVLELSVPEEGARLLSPQLWEMTREAGDE